jgi:hypothetical protein
MTTTSTTAPTSELRPDGAQAPAGRGTQAACPAAARVARHWRPPVLERLGPWRALTLQQSVGIGPGNFGLLVPHPGAHAEELA